MLKKNQTLTEKVLQGSSIVLLFTFLGSPVGYLIRVLYSNTLSIEMFGLFYAALAFFMLLSTYLDLGLGYSVNYFIPKFAKKNDFVNIANIFQYYQITQLIVTATTSLILYFSAHFLASEYFKSATAVNIIYLFCAYLIINGCFAALNMFFIGFQKEVYYSSMQFLRLLLVLLFSIVIWLTHSHNIILYVLAWVASNFFVVISYYFILIKKYPFVLSHFKRNGVLIRSMLSYGLPTLATASMYIFITSVDSIFLTIFKGVREVGIYNIVYPLATLSALVLTPINTLVLPLTSHLMEENNNKISQLIHSILKLVPFIGLYFGLFIALFPSSIAGTLFGSKWVGLVELPLIIFSIGYVLAPLSNFLIAVLSGMGKVKERLKLSTAIVVFSLIVSLFFIPTLGVLGAAIANSLVYLFSVVLFTKAIGRSFKLNYSYSFYLKLGIFGALIFCFVKFFHIAPSGFIQLGISGIIYTILFVFFGLTQQVIDEKMQVTLKKSILKKIANLR